MNRPNPILGARPCTWIWLILIALTFVTYTVGWLGMSGDALVLSVLFIALVKAQMIVDSFMGLRRVRGFWRPVMIAYLLIVGGMIALAFLTS